MRKRRVLKILLAAALCSAVSPAGFAGPAPGSSLAEEFDALVRQDARVATVAYRLAAANAALCSRRTPLTGLTVQTVGQYDANVRATARARLGLGELPTVVAVAPGSPAAAAGLRAGDRLAAANGAIFSPDRNEARRGSSATVRAAYDRLDSAGSGGAFALLIERGGARRELRLSPEAGCAGRVQLVPSDRLNASADDRHVNISTAIAERARSDDALATLMAHEFAHLILDHKHRLGAKRGRPSPLPGPLGAERLTRRTAEREADYLAMHLAARAGYDISVAPAFWREMGAAYRRNGWATESRPDSPERTRTIALAIEEIAAKRLAHAPIVPSGWRSAR